MGVGLVVGEMLGVGDMVAVGVGEGDTEGVCV